MPSMIRVSLIKLLNIFQISHVAQTFTVICYISRVVSLNVNILIWYITRGFIMHLNEFWSYKYLAIL